MVSLHLTSSWDCDVHHKDRVTHMCITLDSRNKNLSGIHNSTFLLFDPHHMQMKKTGKVLFLFHKLDKAQRG